MISEHDGGVGGDVFITPSSRFSSAPTRSSILVEILGLPIPISDRGFRVKFSRALSIED